MTQLEKKKEINASSNIDLLSWLNGNGVSADIVTQIGIFTVLVLYKITTIPVALVQKLSSQLPHLNHCYLSFSVFNLIVAIFLLINVSLTFFQLKKLRKNHIRELNAHINEITFHKGIFSSNWVPRKRRKINLIFFLLLLLMVSVILAYEGYNYLKGCNLQQAYPYGIGGLLCYAMICMRAPIYVMGILNFRYGDRG